MAEKCNFASFCWEWEIFIFHQILMGFFSFDSSHWELSVVCQLLLFSKKKGSKWGKNSILYNMEIFSFSCDFDCFFSKLFLMKNATKNNTSFKDNASQNDHLYCHIMVCSALYCVQHFTVSRTLLCPAHYCVQHIIVSSKILCPHLPKRSFVHLSHFNVLRSYYVLAKHLCFSLYSSWKIQHNRP